MEPLTLDGRIAYYASSHRNPRNELLHCICVPAIVFAVLGFIYGFSLTLALLALAGAVFYYARLGAMAAVEMAIMLVVMLAVWSLFVHAHHIILASVIIFVLAWIGQFVGHYFEGAKPSFFDDLQYLMIGPLYVIAVVKHRFFGGPMVIAEPVSPLDPLSPLDPASPLGPAAPLAE
jgi:uncharacterized membrane protein YGL010W